MGVEVKTIDVAPRAFAPGSHMDLRLGTDLHPLVGKRLLFIVTQYAKRGKDVVLTRKPFLEAEAKVVREQALKTLPIGTVVEGTVRSVVVFGAFIDVLGGIEGPRSAERNEPQPRRRAASTSSRSAWRRRR